MATDKVDSSVGGSGSTRKPVDWSTVIPKRVDSEDTLGVEQNKATWEKLYKYASMATANEEERKAVRAAIYYYCAKNGTSREGDYAGNMMLSNGKVVSAAVIPQAAGVKHIRRFLRANMVESYDFFKSTKIMESDDRFVAKCAALGISSEYAFATSDWMTDCHLFTPGETRAHNTSFNHGLERARRSRGGKGLEEVEKDRVHETLMVQGPVETHGGHGSSVDF